MKKGKDKKIKVDGSSLEIVVQKAAKASKIIDKVARVLPSDTFMAEVADLGEACSLLRDIEDTVEEETLYNLNTGE